MRPRRIPGGGRAGGIVGLDDNPNRRGLSWLTLLYAHETGELTFMCAHGFGKRDDRVHVKVRPETAVRFARACAEGRYTTITTRENFHQIECSITCHVYRDTATFEVKRGRAKGERIVSLEAVKKFGTAILAKMAVP